MDTQNRGIELALFLTLPATVALIVAAEPIVRGLFQHGQFTRRRHGQMRAGRSPPSRSACPPMCS